MVNCDLFERRYEAWKKGRLSADESAAMQDHASSCRFCKVKDEQTQNLRTLIASVPQISPQDGFEFRLQQRINALSKRKSIPARRRASIFPRWGALGAGLATGLAIGFVVFMPRNAGYQVAPNPETYSEITAPAPETITPLADSAAFNHDTSRTNVLSHDYDASIHSQTVSQQGR